MTYRTLTMVASRTSTMVTKTQVDHGLKNTPRPWSQKQKLDHGRKMARRGAPNSTMWSQIHNSTVRLGSLATDLWRYIREFASRTPPCVAWLTYWRFDSHTDFLAKQISYEGKRTARTATEIHNDLLWSTYWFVVWLIDWWTGCSWSTLSWSAFPWPGIDQFSWSVIFLMSNFPD